MVRRVCIMFPDGSISVMPNGDGETAARVQAFREAARFNKGERDDRERAQFGLIEVDLMSFKELR